MNVAIPPSNPILTDKATSVDMASLLVTGPPASNAWRNGLVTRDHRVGPVSGNPESRPVNQGRSGNALVVGDLMRGLDSEAEVLLDQLANAIGTPLGGAKTHVRQRGA